MDAETFARTLAALPGVEAVTLGGSRARGEARPGSDWDFGLYYRGDFDAASLRALGHEGEVVEPGEWGRLMNGGAWLTIDGERVDVLYRELGAVERWTEEAEAGRYAVDALEGFVAGMPSYVLVGELALASVLAGELPRPEYPPALREAAPPRWGAGARFSLAVAESAAARGDVVHCTGLLAKAGIAAAHARLAERGEWALNEKGILRRAGLARAEAILAAVGTRPTDLGQAVARMRLAVL